MNQYGSVVQRFLARNVLEQAINPPNAFQIADASWVNTYLRSEQKTSAPFQYINPNSNIVLKRGGLFCNFADGLVLNSLNRARISIAFEGLTPNTAITITSGTLTPGSKALSAGTAFLTELSAGDRIVGPFGNPYRIASVTDNANAVLDEYAIFGGSIAGTNPYTATTFFGVRFPGFLELNTMYDLEYFAPVASYSAATVTIIGARAIIDNENPAATVDYMTKTISTTFAADTARMDVYADIEYTRQ